MPIQTVAIMSPGEMGHAVGRVLIEGGLEVIACLEGRGDLTKNFAAKAGIRDAGSLETMVGEADLVLSIVPPAKSVETAAAASRAMRSAGKTPPYADCNAVSPDTTRLVGKEITRAGAEYIDGGIIGGPPSKNSVPRFYVSGPKASLMSELDGKGIAVRPIGDEIGRASGLKMCYASMTKGTLALQAAVFTTTEALGLTSELKNELMENSEGLFEKIEKGTRRLPSVSGRYIGEMEEIAATYAAVGMTPKFHQGALDVYRFLVSTPLAEETSETIDASRTLEQTAKVFVDHLPMK
ncbi:MAG: NAD(P)-dependent oxidoreductase [Nitrospinaceae bacterium]|jgi:3-hydroxyisobutyrate dehydrogenase-like beta-hydroxyacid dehydrogenase|nr:NAD(P)-dependent oxidoreductase [Nitrospinaceae bacterium]MBT3432429.1 NAD(P)-dependent oxidoreductase [Nitrospinaceae bacterium]MBT3821553.1 NAD(P)-dependent oxidoreductase [Nitrospinaceae bacterium]MBT4094644.1 NAD(P)-dependent oxidoreductase [Nitrospinaceae bacterium]MBT4430855.1 NAD(P)-dependent oxidoreductase [Nitrospinaceae bacterium]